MLRKHWRRWFRAFHRDIGYVAVALILAYSLSGIALNHAEDWNPNYTFETRAIAVGSLTGGREEMALVVAQKLARDPKSINGTFLETERELRVYFHDGEEARVDTVTGRGTLKEVTRRAVFFQVNALHLNNLRGAWKWIADAFAVALIVLAITGLTMMKGDRGFWGRGKYFVGAGLLLPIGGVVYMYWG